MADDARTTYINDRRREEEADAAPTTDAGSMDSDIQRYLQEQGLLDTNGEPIAEDPAAAEGAPASPDGAPAADGAAPAAPPDPNVMQPAPLTGKPKPVRQDIKEGIVRGPIKGAANLLDFSARTWDSALEYLGVPEETFVYNTQLGDIVDKALGTPSTVAGAMAQDVSSIVVPMKAVMGTMQIASKAQYITKALIGSSVVETMMTSDKAASLSNYGASQPKDHWANNWVTRLLAVENDDSEFQKFMKRNTENMILNGVTDAAAKAVGWGIEAARGWGKDKKAMAATAAESGLKLDKNINDIIDEGVAAKAEQKIVEAAKEVTAPTPKPADEAATAATAAPKSIAPEVPPAPAKLPKELAGAKPRYGAGRNQYNPVFESDVDRAAYIAAQPTRSKADAKYVAWGMEATGMTEAEFRLHGAKVRAQIKNAAKGVATGSEIPVSPLWAPTKPKVGGEAAPTAPRMADEAVNPEAAAVAPEAPTAAPKAADEAAPAEAPAATQTTGEAPPKPITDAVEQKNAALLKAEQERTERLTRAFETSTEDPGTLKAQKEAAAERGFQFTPEQTARIDASIAARTVAALPPVKDHPFGGHLMITKAHADALGKAFELGDFHGATGILGEIIGDTTNFNKIVESGDITDLLAALAHEFQKDENSYRILVRRSREATFATAEEELTALAKEHGTDANAIRIALEKQLPGRDLTATLTAYRMLEVSLANRAVELASLAKAEGSKATKAELARTIALTAIVNDRRAGVVSDIARALNSLQKMVDVPKGMVLRAAAAEARVMGLDAFINSVGGGERNMNRIIDSIVGAGSPEAKAKAIKVATKNLDATMGDALFAFAVHNALSGLFTPLKNITSSAFYQGAWKTGSNLTGAAFRDAHSVLRGQDPRALRKEWIRWRATRAAARKVFSQDSMMRRNIGSAWETGQRVTTPTGGTFMEGTPAGKVTRLGEGNMARAHELAKIARSGGLFKIPFGSKVPVGRWVFGQERLNKLATALDASAETKRLWSPLSSDAGKEIEKRYGYTAKLIDYLGRTNSWSMPALASGDELNAGIARSAALEAETFDAVADLRLDPKASEAYVRDVIENIDTIPALQAKEADGLLDAAGKTRLALMESVLEKADNYVREVTFTENPGVATQLAAHARTAIPGFRWMLFFVRSPGNIARAAVRESPVGQVGMAAGAALRGDSAAVAEHTGRAVFASAAAYVGWEQIVAGRMTGSGPSDPEANQLWRDEGNVPYTYRLPIPGEDNDVVINYGSYFDPIALPFQVMADLAESAEYMDDTTLAAFGEEFGQRFMRLLESKSWGASMVDTFDLISGRGDREKALVRIMKNFVPQSRMLATLRTNGLPVPRGVGSALFGKPSPDDEIMSLQAFIDGRKTKGLVDSGRGVMLNDKNEVVDIHGGIVDNPFVVHLVSDIAEDLPPGLAEEWLEFHAKVLGVRAEHGKYVQRDQLGEKRILPIGYGPQNATGLLGDDEDLVRQELIDVGMDKSVKETFSKYLGQELTPEQQDYFQRRYRRPTKDHETAYEMFKAVIESDDYKELGETVGDLKGMRYKILNEYHETRLFEAKIALEEKFPVLKKIAEDKLAQEEALFTKEGTDALAADRAARGNVLIRKFQEAVNGND